MKGGLKMNNCGAILVGNGSKPGGNIIAVCDTHDYRTKLHVGHITGYYYNPDQIGNFHPAEATVTWSTMPETPE